MTETRRIQKKMRVQLQRSECDHSSGVGWGAEPWDVLPCRRVSVEAVGVALSRALGHARSESVMKSKGRVGGKAYLRVQSRDGKGRVREERWGNGKGAALGRMRMRSAWSGTSKGHRSSERMRRSGAKTKERKGERKGAIDHKHRTGRRLREPPCQRRCDHPGGVFILGGCTRV